MSGVVSQSAPPKQPLAQRSHARARHRRPAGASVPQPPRKRRKESFTVEVNTLSEYCSEGPGYAQIVVDKKLAELIRRMQAAVIDLKVYCMEVFDDTPYYKDSDLEVPPDPDRDIETIPMVDWDGCYECSILHVTSTQFYWRALIKHTEVHMETEAISIKELQCL